MRAPLIALLIATPTILLGCSSDSESSDGSTTTESAQDSTDTTDAGDAEPGDEPCSRSSSGSEGTTVTGNTGGEATIGAGKVFEDFPSQIPLPEDATLDGTSSAADEGDAKVWIIRCNVVTTEPDTAWDGYKSALDDAGCEVTEETRQSAGLMYMAAGHCALDGYEVNLALMRAPGMEAAEDQYRFDIGVRQQS